MKKSKVLKIDDTKHIGQTKRSSTNANKQITPLKSKNKMRFVGIDVHKRSMQVAVKDKSGKLLLNQKVGVDHDSVKKLFS